MRLNNRLDELEAMTPEDDAAIAAYRAELQFMANTSGNTLADLHATLRPVPDFMARTRILFDAYMRMMRAPADVKPPAGPRGMVHGCPLDVNDLHTLHPPAWFRFHDQNVLDYIRGHEERNHGGHPVPWGRDGRVIANVLEDSDEDAQEQARVQAERERQRYLAALQDEVRDYVMRRPPF